MVNDILERLAVEDLIDSYTKKIKDQLKRDPANQILEGKLAAAQEISHRLRVLSRGGLRIL